MNNFKKNGQKCRPSLYPKIENACYRQKEIQLKNQIEQMNLECELMARECEQVTRERDRMQCRIDDLTAEVELLKKQIANDQVIDSDVKFSLIQIVDYCKERASWETVKEIVFMLYALLRYIGTKADYDLADSVEQEFRKRMHATQISHSSISIGQAHIEGAMYEVKNNEHVNLGEGCHERE